MIRHKGYVFYEDIVSVSEVHHILEQTEYRFIRYNKRGKHMFTGIVQAIAPIIEIKEKNHFRTHYVRLPATLLPGLTIGASVAHNGCCLTVTGITGDIVSFDLMKETLQLTNLGTLKVGDEINLERAMTLQAEIGGHLMSGHIICTAKLTKIVTSEYNRQIWFSLSDRALMKYILYKGYIGIDGISLSVGEVAGNRFCVHLIPETLLRTTLGKKRLSDSVNIEIDSQTQTIVYTVERILAMRERRLIKMGTRCADYLRRLARRTESTIAGIL